MNYRTEKDCIGERDIPVDCLYGIHTSRAIDNFSVSNKCVNLNLIHAIVEIKKAAAITHSQNGTMDSKKASLIIEACDEILLGIHDNSFVTCAIQGGAGTSTNMNVNEVIANIAIKKANGKCGDYAIVHPLNDVNLSQSTNDVYPTALRVAAIKLLRTLSDEFAELQTELQKKENEYSDVIKLGRTQLMDALPIMVGQEFGAYAQAIGRDRWRVYKVEERLRQVNLGGTAIGTGMNADRQFIFTIIEVLRDLTGLGLAKAEFPIDLTQNNDVFVEVSGILKASATNLIKIANDLRLMNSGPRGGLGEITLEEVQAGSSIMPGKINPVIPEMVVQVGIKVIANDSAITTAACYGQLELNAFTPIIAESLLESLELLINTVKTFIKCIRNLKVNEDRCKEHLLNSTALVTALTTYIGYDKAAEIAKEALSMNKTVKDIVLEHNLIDEAKLDSILDPFQITKPGIPG